MRVKVKHQSNPAYDCFRIATASLELSLRSQQDWLTEHNCVTGITFCAFAIEAMLNYFGGKLILDWQNEEQQRKGRKKSHKAVFTAANLPNYLGSSTYQLADECFRIRDFLAHGKSVQEEFHVPKNKNESDEDRTRQIIFSSSETFRNCTPDKLKIFIDVARKIERDIQDNAFYPGQEYLPKDEREHLIDCPLSVSGLKEWYDDP